MKLNCKRIDLPDTPGEEIFHFPEDTGLPFLFDVAKELTADPAAMDAAVSYTHLQKVVEAASEELKAIYRQIFIPITKNLEGSGGLL